MTGSKNSSLCWVKNRKFRFVWQCCIIIRTARGFYFSDEDVIPTGDTLLTTLREFGCDFVYTGQAHG